MKKRWWVFVAVAAAFILVYALARWSRAKELASHPWDGPLAERDLDSIRTDTLRVLVTPDPLVWNLAPAGARGLAWAWLQGFAAAHGLHAVAVPLQYPDSLLAALWEGRGDVIAAPLHLDRAERRHFHVTEAFAEWTPMVARLRPEAGAGKGPSLGVPVDTVFLAAASPFAHHAYQGLSVAGAQATDSLLASEEELLLAVLLGHRPAAVVSRLRAAHEAARFPPLQFEGPVGKPIPWRLLTRRNAPKLQQALATWQASAQAHQSLATLIGKATGPLQPPGPLHARRMKGIDPDSISPYDRYFRTHAEGLAFDWRLLAAMAWKESRFDSTVTSRKGAMGIMQIMPRTAARFGLDTASGMNDHIRAAARYLARLDTIWLRAIPDREQRLRFMLASYNAGPGHIIDAQRLADQLGLDPTRWDGHVERAVLLLAKPAYYARPEMKNGYCKGSQVFHYVRGVLAVHDQLRGQGIRPAKPGG